MKTTDLLFTCILMPFESSSAIKERSSVSWITWNFIGQIFFTHLQKKNFLVLDIMTNILIFLIYQFLNYLKKN